MKEVIGRALYTVLGFLLALLWVSHANAGVLVGSNENCTHLAQVAQSLAENRDAGQTWEQAQVALKAGIAEAKGQPNSIIMDDEDANYALAVTKRIWNEYKDMNPFDVSVEVLVGCVKAKRV